MQSVLVEIRVDEGVLFNYRLENQEEVGNIV